MAKQKADREDLFREGTAMPIRGRLLIDQQDVVIGFRDDGAFSLYWDQDPVFQFDADRQLRRVFLNCNRYKSQNRRLVRLTQPAADQTAAVGRLRLLEETVSADEEAQILQRLTGCLQQIQEHLALPVDSPDAHTLQSVGASAPEFRTVVLQWIASLPRPVRIADQPSV